MACPGESMGAAYLQSAASITTTAMRIAADNEIASLNRELQQRLHNDRLRHERELQLLSFDFQERQLEKQIDAQERISDKQIDAQERIAAANAWRNYLYSKGIQPFDRGAYITQCTNIQNPNDLIILIDTKVYQEGDSIKKNILPYNPMAIVFQEFKRVNQQTGRNAYLYDLPYAFGSESAVRQFCRNEFYERPAIIVYSGFSGSYFFMNAFCNGIFAHQIYINTQSNGKICVNPLSSEILSLMELPIKRMELAAENDGVVEAVAGCVISSYLQMLIDSYVLFYGLIKNYRPQAKVIFDNKLAHLSSFFDEAGPKKFEQVKQEIGKVIANAEIQQGFIIDQSNISAINQIKQHYIF